MCSTCSTRPSFHFGRFKTDGSHHHPAQAGLSLNLADLKKVGHPAVMMSCVPASFEILGYFLFAPLLLGLSPLEGAVMGAVLAAVSPAVVVPRMVSMMENGIGTNKSIPQMIMAGASCMIFL